MTVCYSFHGEINTEPCLWELLLGLITEEATGAAA